MITIALENRSTVVSPADFMAAVAAAQHQISNEFRAHWGIDAKLAVRYAAPGQWVLRVFDDTDQQGALGYHDDPVGLPTGSVFARTTMNAGLSWTVTLSHELCLAGETIIPLADGSKPTIETLAKRGGMGARKTGKNKHTFRVVFADGSSVRCTPDHSFLKLSGEFVPAKNLVPGDMLPTYSRLDGVNSAGTYSVPLSNNGVGVGTVVNRQHLRVCELGIPGIFPSRLPAFRHHIGHVVGIGSNEQMSRIDAGRHVAVMADKQDGWTVGQFVTQPVSIHQLWSDTDHSVSSLRNAARPNPTRPQLRPVRRHGAVLVHLCPKTLLKSGMPEVEEGLGGIGCTGPVNSSPVSRAQSFGFEGSSASQHRARFESLANRHIQIVHKIENDSKCDVYDLTIPDRHNFAVGNGVFAHNCEMLIDPFALASVQMDAQTFVALEVCDACEGDQFGYKAPNGVLVSDFVLPAWFDPTIPGPWSNSGAVPGAFQLLAGGYTGIWAAATGWTQKTGDLLHPKAHQAAAPSARRESRNKNRFRISLFF